MTRIDFYLLEHGAEGSKDAAVCKLTNKAFKLGHRVYILAANREEAQRLDRLLWTFNDGSFIPHALSTELNESEPPVVIGNDEPSATHEDVLISLAAEVPEYFSRFQRVAEVVDDSDTNKQLARERFRFYRDRGYALQTHQL